MIELVRASPAHVGRIATRMREADAAECAALGMSPKQGLRKSLTASVIAYTAKVDGRPEGMFGVTPGNTIEGIGHPWMLATDAAFDCARALLTAGPGLIDLMHRRFRRLENMVSAENERAIRMLGRWGFEVGDEQMMVGGVPFLPFWKEAADVR